MVCYVYDGSFEGLLTSVYESYYRKDNPEEIFREEDFLQTFLTEPVYIKTDKEKADKVYNGIVEKISYEALTYIFYVFLSELKTSSTLTYNYTRLGFKLGKDINMHIHNDIVIEVHRTAKKVTNEKHKMLGFVRFKFIKENLYYAPIEPDHNVLQLITPHFASRFSNERFIIHDRKREIASIYNGDSWAITELTVEDGDKFLSKNEDSIYETLWKEYFKSTTIENRKNPRLQKRYMPERYWKFLTEF